MKNATEFKKNLLDQFDTKFFGLNVSEEKKTLNRVGKVNVGWNIDYIKSLPEYDLLIDVGAADDFYNLHNARKDAISVLIDPNYLYEELYVEFFQSRLGYFNICAVGEFHGETEYNYYPDAPYLSTTEQRDDVDELVRKSYKVAVKPLDDIVDMSVCNTGALLKLDIEGSELKALKGAPKVLKKCVAVICEISLDNNFPGGNNFSEINRLMLEAGFGLRDIIRVPRLTHNKYPAQVLDVVFGR